MARVEQSIDVNVPLSAAYNQWTQFEDFPRFMDGVREVRQLDDSHLHWRAHRHGREVEWESEITGQIPDQRIDWRDSSGRQHSGSITFEALGDDRSRVRMTMDFEPSNHPQASDPEEIAERIGQDLERFKNLVETQGRASGGWRGVIHDGHTTHPSSAEHADATAGGAQAGQAADQRGAEQRGSSAHPSGRWESWTDESAFGSDDGGPEREGGRSQSRQDAGARGQSGRASGGFGGSGGGRGGAQAWLRNQFPGLEEPMGMMRRMSEEMDQLFDRFIGRPIASRFGQGQGGMAGKWMPQVEVVQQEGTLLVCIDLPGIKREDVQIEVLHDRLMVEGERREQSVTQNREAYRRSERSYGRFYRMIPLPHGVDPDQAQARMQDGVLEVRIPMPEAARKARRVDIS